MALLARSCHAFAPPLGLAREERAMPYRPTEGGADAWATNELRLRDGTPAVLMVRGRAGLAKIPRGSGRGGWVGVGDTTTAAPPTTAAA
jgi:hypothetical protein